MARAKWSQRVWKPMTKEGHSLPFTKELLRGSLVWHCPALELTAPCGVLWRDIVWPPHTIGNPRKDVTCWCVIAARTASFYLLYVGENYFGIQLWYTRCRGKGTKQESTELQTWHSVYVVKGLGSQLPYCSCGLRFPEHLIIAW